MKNIFQRPWSTVHNPKRCCCDIQELRIRASAMPFKNLSEGSYTPSAIFVFCAPEKKRTLAACATKLSRHVKPWKPNQIYQTLSVCMGFEQNVESVARWRLTVDEGFLFYSWSLGIVLCSRPVHPMHSSMDRPDRLCVKRLKYRAPLSSTFFLFMLAKRVSNLHSPYRFRIPHRDSCLPPCLPPCLLSVCLSCLCLYISVCWLGQS